MAIIFNWSGSSALHKRPTYMQMPPAFLVSALLMLLLTCTQCRQNEKNASDLAAQETDSTFLKVNAAPKPKPRPEVHYHLLPVKENKEWLRGLQPGDTLNALLLLNRVDAGHLLRQDTLIVPDTFTTNPFLYSPFPIEVIALQSVHKILFISYPAQAFAVYENGKLARWGASSMGKESTPTPTGLFATNWRSKKTISTIDADWIMEWYFNLENFEGVSMHEYALPGYPASHACVRLFKEDAIWLYNWADQWILPNSTTIAAYGTPVVIYGSYPFKQIKPWLTQAENNKALHITEAELTLEVQQHLPLIMQRQTQRENYLNQQAD